MGSLLSKNAILKAAVDVCKEMDDMADTALPNEIADIVKLHSKIAVGLAIIPLPGGDLAGEVANVWGMYLRINKKLGLKLSETKLKTVAAGVAANVANSVALTLGFGVLAKFLPGPGTVAGAAVEAATFYGITITSAYVYMKALIAMSKAEGKDFSGINIETDLSSAIDNIFKDDKSEIKDVMKNAKKDYKKEDMSDAVRLAKEAREQGKA